MSAKAFSFYNNAKGFFPAYFAKNKKVEKI